VPSRIPDHLAGRAVDGLPGYLRGSLSPGTAMPLEARAPDPGYPGYSGTTGPEHPSFAEAGSTEAGIAGNADDTSPLPVILNADPPVREPSQHGPRRPASRPPGQHPASAQRPVPAPFPVQEPVPAPAPEPVSWPGSGGHPDDARPEHAAAAQAKLEQLKDLYMTAEAIGEDALVRHFDELRQRQRSLISGYFQQMGLTPPRSPAASEDEQPQGGGSAPG
jgi:hypothetical protein